MTTNIDITNRALAEIGTRSQITSFTDGSQEAQYASLLYNGFRDFLLRQGDYEFALTSANTIAQPAPLPPWIFAYTYPTDCVRVRQLLPTGVNLLDPYPVEFTIIDSGGGRVIGVKVAASVLVYTSNTPSETLWDSMFTEAMVRYLGSGLMFALENGGRPSAMMLDQAMEFAKQASLTDG